MNDKVMGELRGKVVFFFFSFLGKQGEAETFYFNMLTELLASCLVLVGFNLTLIFLFNLL